MIVIFVQGGDWMAYVEIIKLPGREEVYRFSSRVTQWKSMKRENHISSRRD